MRCQAPFTAAASFFEELLNRCCHLTVLYAHERSLFGRSFKSKKKPPLQGAFHIRINQINRYTFHIRQDCRASMISPIADARFPPPKALLELTCWKALVLQTEEQLLALSSL